MTVSSDAWLLRPNGPLNYASAYDAMHELAMLRGADEIPDTLVLVQHPPTFTAGRRSDPSHVRWTRERMLAQGAELHEVDRGGSLTFHGPGQLVGYPIFRLGSRLDVIPHMRRMEEVVIRTAADLGIDLERSERQTGVWTADGAAKVCAIGVRLDVHKVTLHGWGLNCDTDLAWFDAIVPCGIGDRSVTTLSALAQRTIDVDEVAPLVEHHAAEVFERRWVPAPAEISAAWDPPRAASPRSVLVARR